MLAAGACNIYLAVHGLITRKCPDIEYTNRDGILNTLRRLGVTIVEIDRVHRAISKYALLAHNRNGESDVYINTR